MRKFFRVLGKVEEAAVGTGLVALVLLVFLSVILRLLRVSVSWNIDLALLLLAWVSFLGADIAWRNGQIIGVDLIVRRLPFVLRRIVDIIIYLVVLATLVVIVVFGIRLAIAEELAMFQSMPIPRAVLTASLVAAAFSMVLSTTKKIKDAVLAIATHKQDASAAEATADTAADGPEDEK